jgi:hypothetical protein
MRVVIADVGEVVEAVHRVAGGGSVIDPRWSPSSSAGAGPATRSRS